MTLKKKERELLAQAVAKPSILKSADPDILKNSLFFMEAAVQNPEVLKYADKKITQNWDVAEYIVQKNGMAYRYFSRAIKENVGYALDAIRNTTEITPYILKNAHKELCSMYSRGINKKDRNLALYFAQTLEFQLHSYIGDFVDDKDIMMVAVKNRASHIHSASPRLKNDIELLRAAYKENPYVFERGDLEKSKALFINDRDFILEVVRESEHTCIEPEYADDEELVMIALAKSIRMYMYLSDRLHDREDIAKMAVVEDGELLRYTSDRLYNDRAFIESVVSLNPAALEFVADKFQEDKEIVELAIKKDPRYFEFASDKLKGDADFVKAMFVYSPTILRCAPARLLKDKEYILDMFANGTVQTDDFSILKRLPEKLADDEEVVAAACVANSGSEFRFASKRLRDSIDFVLNLMMSYDIDLTDCLSEEIMGDNEVQSYLKKWDLKKRFNL